jgi:hypothetical protein
MKVKGEGRKEEGGKRKDEGSTGGDDRTGWHNAPTI